MPYFNLWQSNANNQYYFNFRGNNHERVLQSEGYTTEANCRAGINSVKVLSPYDSSFSRFTANNGQPYFVMKANNGQSIASSETYTTTAARENAIDLVKTDRKSVV